jgi:flagellar hook-length control protein FliK
VTTSHVTVDTPKLPGPAAGTGGATARHGKPATGASPNGFSAILDSLTQPSAPRSAPRTDAAPKSSSATGPRASLATEPEAAPPELDDLEDEALDPPASAMTVAGVALLDPLILSDAAGAAQPQADSSIVGTPAAESSTGANADDRTTPSSPAAVVDGAVLPAGVSVPHTPGTETPGATEAAGGGLVESPAADMAARLEQMDDNGRPRASGHAPVLSSPSGVKTADVVRSTLQGPQAQEAAPAGPVATPHPAASVEPLAADRHSPRAGRSLQDAPVPSRTVAPQETLTMPLAASESKTAGDWSGQGGSDHGFAGPETSRPAVASSGQLLAGFLVPAPVADMAASPSEVAPATVAADTSRSQDVGQANLEGQLVQTMRTLWRGGVGEARVTLKPEYLGAITISLRLEGGGLQAHLRVEDPQVAAWVQANESLLKAGLAGQGLTLERLVVSDDSRSRDERGQQGDRERREPKRQGRGTPDEAGFTLEV